MWEARILIKNLYVQIIYKYSDTEVHCINAHKLCFTYLFLNIISGLLHSMNTEKILHYHWQTGG